MVTFKQNYFKLFFNLWGTTERQKWGYFVLKFQHDPRLPCVGMKQCGQFNKFSTILNKFPFPFKILSKRFPPKYHESKDNHSDFQILLFRAQYFAKNESQGETQHLPAITYLFKVNNRNTRKNCVICSKLTMKTTEQHHWLILNKSNAESRLPRFKTPPVVIHWWIRTPFSVSLIPPHHTPKCQYFFVWYVKTIRHVLCFLICGN